MKNKVGVCIFHYKESYVAEELYEYDDYHFALNSDVYLDSVAIISKTDLIHVRNGSLVISSNNSHSPNLFFGEYKNIKIIKRDEVINL